jgi:hypothetical protein
MTSTMTTTPTATARRTPVVIGVCLVDAALLVTSGIIHLHLALGPYKHVSTLNWLFVVQFAVAVVAALVLLATRSALVALGSVLFFAGTIVGYILARTRGIFGFKLPFATSLANDALGVEIAGIVLLCGTAWLLSRRA